MNDGISSSEIVGTSTSSHRVAELLQRRSGARAAEVQGSSVGMPSGAWAISPMRRLPGRLHLLRERPRRHGRVVPGVGSGPQVASSTAAASATVRASAPSTTAPSQLCASARHPPATGLQAYQPAVGGGDADRAAAVGGVGDREHAAGDRRRRAAAGAAGRAVGVPGLRVIP